MRAALHQDRSGECGSGPPTQLGTNAAAVRPPIRTYSGGAGGCPAGTHYMGIRPNGDVTPCPYLPVFAGSLRNASLADLWTSSELFTGIRQRTSLGGRCGECEMNGHCGGCRARAYGMTGDVMAEDPLCTHTPGTFAGSPLLAPGRASSRDARGTTIEYGAEPPTTIAWDDAAAERMKKIPAFVRGMVVEGRRGVLPQERPRPRDRRRARADPRADADPEIFGSRELNSAVSWLYACTRSGGGDLRWTSPPESG